MVEHVLCMITCKNYSWAACRYIPFKKGINQFEGIALICNTGYHLYLSFCGLEVARNP